MKKFFTASSRAGAKKGNSFAFHASVHVQLKSVFDRRVVLKGRLMLCALTFKRGNSDASGE